MDALPTWAPLDWALLAVLAISVLVGLWRGLVYEVLSLAGWLVAWFVAQRWGASLTESLPLGSPGSASRAGASFAVVFIATLLVWTLLAKLVRMLISATPLQLFDRVLGAGFGLLRGVLILLVVATLVALTPLSKAPWWQASRGATWLGHAVEVLRPMWPDAPKPAGSV
jgi:membrane protein required for colicin V production